MTKVQEAMLVRVRHSNMYGTVVEPLTAPNKTPQTGGARRNMVGEFRRVLLAPAEYVPDKYAEAALEADFAVREWVLERVKSPGIYVLDGEELKTMRDIWLKEFNRHGGKTLFERWDD